MRTTINGEYWFDDTGATMYADGDVGDMNHESYVIDRCANEVASYFNVNTDLCIDGGVSLEYFEESILEKIISELKEEYDEKEKELENNHIGENEELENLLNDLSADYDEKVEDIEADPADAMIKYLVDNHNMDEKYVSELVMVGYGSSRDAREYAIKNWNWARVHGDSIEVNKLDKETLKLVCRGINNALDEEDIYYHLENEWEEEEEEELFCDIFDVDDMSDEEYEERLQSFKNLPLSDKIEMAIDHHVYSISTYTGKSYNIKLIDMENGNVESLERSDIEINHPTAATQQLRQMDVEKMPDFYKGIIGDSFKNTFKFLMEKYKI